VIVFQCAAKCRAPKDRERDQDPDPPIAKGSQTVPHSRPRRGTKRFGCVRSQESTMRLGAPTEAEWLKFLHASLCDCSLFPLDRAAPEWRRSRRNLHRLILTSKMQQESRNSPACFFNFFCHRTLKTIRQSLRVDLFRHGRQFRVLMSLSLFHSISGSPHFMPGKVVESAVPCDGRHLKCSPFRIRPRVVRDT
jgi:hypothetical protein